MSCKFGALLKEKLKDKFVHGLRKGPILDKIFECEHMVSLEDLVEVAIKRGATNFMDDLIVTGKTKQEHLANLEAVFEKLEKAGFRLNLKKCKFFEKQIKFLGHVITKEGLHKDSDKVKAIIQSPRPKNVTELKAFLGMINYYGKFVPNLSEILEPLHLLLKSNRTFHWTESCEDAFKSVKEQIASEQNLATRVKRSEECQEEWRETTELHR